VRADVQPFSQGFSLFDELRGSRRGDELWEKKIAAVARFQRCGWLKDRFGVCLGRSSRRSSERGCSDKDSRAAQKRSNAGDARNEELDVAELEAPYNG